MVKLNHNSLPSALGGRCNFLMLFVFIVWLGEVFVVQELTLVAPHSQSSLSIVLDRVFRFALDSMLLAGLLILLPRKGLPVVFLATLVYGFGLLAFYSQFHAPLSARLIVSNASEGVAVTDAAVSLIRPVHALLVVSLVAKMLLLHRSGWGSALMWPTRLRRGGATLLAYGVLIAVLNVAYKPMNRLRTWETTAGVGAVYGYFPTWIAELTLFDDGVLLERANARARELRDALRPLEAPLPAAERIVFLQVESLDAALLDFRVGGVEVMPRLDALRRTSLTYVVRAKKITGSLDSDFKALMGVLPSADVPNYKVPGYSYANALPQVLADHGYETLAIHGVSGQFFNRREAYERMGFDALKFREELEADGLLSTGWCVPDDVVLRYSAERLRRATGKHFQIVITATSHIPFRHLPEAVAPFFPGSRKLSENYIDVMHWVDQEIGAYIDLLPEGTLVVVYGDHVSQVTDPDLGYAERVYNDVGLVPFIVHQVGRDLHATQRLPPSRALSGEFQLLDGINYVTQALRTPRQPIVVR